MGREVGFDLPAATGLRLERPAADIDDALFEYAVNYSDPQIHAAATGWLVPNWATIRVLIEGPMFGLSKANRPLRMLPPAALVGTFSRAFGIVTNGGATVQIPVTPIGWSRLFGARADQLRDTITPLDALLPVPAVRDLEDAMHRVETGLEVKALLDDFFRRTLRSPAEDDLAIRVLMHIIERDEGLSIVESCERHGIAQHRLQRVANRYFGFPPKLLKSRFRFLTTLMQVIATPVTSYDPIRVAGFEIPYFLRLSQYFLGMTPRQFAHRQHPYFAAVTRAREQVFGVPIPTMIGRHRDAAPRSLHAVTSPDLPERMRPPMRREGVGRQG